MSTVVGIVAEGTHDFIMLEPLIRYELAKRGFSDVKIKPLQPAPDATGKMGDGGWGRVMGWCSKYTGAKLSTFFTPLFADDEVCSAIVLHLDGDALEHVAPMVGVNLPATVDVDNRVRLLVDCINIRLDPTSEQRRRLAIAIPVQHTEAWLIAMGGFNGDASQVDAKKEFRKKFSYKKRIKLENYYITKVRSCTSGTMKEPTCVSYKMFTSEISALEVV